MIIFVAISINSKSRVAGISESTSANKRQLARCFLSCFLLTNIKMSEIISFLLVKFYLTIPYFKIFLDFALAFALDKIEKELCLYFLLMLTHLQQVNPGLGGQIDRGSDSCRPCPLRLSRRKGCTRRPNRVL